MAGLVQLMVSVATVQLQAECHRAIAMLLIKISKPVLLTLHHSFSTTNPPRSNRPSCRRQLGELHLIETAERCPSFGCIPGPPPEPINRMLYLGMSRAGAPPSCTRARFPVPLDPPPPPLTLPTHRCAELADTPALAAPCESSSRQRNASAKLIRSGLIHRRVRGGCRLLFQRSLFASYSA